MAMIGLPKSSSVIPVARQRARAPAIFLPWVEVFDLYSGISFFNPFNGTFCLDIIISFIANNSNSHGTVVSENY
jgi:hypothetical protein